MSALSMPEIAVPLALVTAVAGSAATMQASKRLEARRASYLAGDGMGLDDIFRAEYFM
jgi:hypothetical protein